MSDQLKLKALFWLAVATWAACLTLDKQNPSLAQLKPSSTVLGVVILVATAFERWAWSWRIWFPWFVQVPNLQGTYQGQINSLWEDPSTGKPRGKINAYLVVRQTFGTIHLRLFTEDSESCSVSSALTRSDDGHLDLLVIYRNEPRLPSRTLSPIHYGGMKLTPSDADFSSLSGSYWTDRSSVGEVEFVRSSRKKSHGFRECSKAHPIGDATLGTPSQSVNTSLPDA